MANNRNSVPRRVNILGILFVIASVALKVRQIVEVNGITNLLSRDASGQAAVGLDCVGVFVGVV